MQLYALIQCNTVMADIQKRKRTIKSNMGGGKTIQNGVNVE